MASKVLLVEDSFEICEAITDFFADKCGRVFSRWSRGISVQFVKVAAVLDEKKERIYIKQKLKCKVA
ncbi:MAG: hypothetical protein MJ166_07600 [Clostridia bacterium]|nr:hypothetical protein [Clostridia bacterium]